MHAPGLPSSLCSLEYDVRTHLELTCEGSAIDSGGCTEICGGWTDIRRIVSNPIRRLQIALSADHNHRCELLWLQ